MYVINIYEHRSASDSFEHLVGAEAKAEGNVRGGMQRYLRDLGYDGAHAAVSDILMHRNRIVVEIGGKRFRFILEKK